ncbi:M23 family metallopeptidase [Microbacterium sp. NPDC058342]|uniref:M23 family metallopeptidase n=1 Tax=Microbacterium sp. NPDC058342 TaxID=3346454 RepID=UPI003655687B
MAAEIVTDNAEDPKKPARRRLTRTAKTRSSVKPMRTVAIFAAVGALVAAVALPAYAATKPTDAAAATLQQMAVDDAQSIVVASEATSAPIERGAYSATTPEEIAKKKAEAAAKARAAAAARAASSGSRLSDADLRLVAAGSGQVRYPLPGGSYYVSRTLGSGHNGADMVAPAGTPIFAAAGGVVRTSSESYFGYGVAVVIDSVVGGQRVSTLYGHMTNGTRAVQAGQVVQPGQFIGKVGNTGRSYGAHLHFEVKVNGSLVEPIGWLRVNAG